METFGLVVTIVVVALMWAAAAAFGRDSRDGADRVSRGIVRDRPQRIGD